MSWETIATVATAIGGPTTVAALYRWAKAQGKADALAEQSRKTVEAKNAEIADLATERDELAAENARLWALIETLTTPQARE